MKEAMEVLKIEGKININDQPKNKVQHNIWFKKIIFFIYNQFLVYYKVRLRS